MNKSITAVLGTLFRAMFMFTQMFIAVYLLQLYGICSTLIFTVAEAAAYYVTSECVASASNGCHRIKVLWAGLMVGMLYNSLLLYYADKFGHPLVILGLLGGIASSCTTSAHTSLREEYYTNELILTDIGSLLICAAALVISNRVGIYGTFIGLAMYSVLLFFLALGLKDEDDEIEIELDRRSAYLSFGDKMQMLTSGIVCFKSPFLVFVLYRLFIVCPEYDGISTALVILCTITFITAYLDSDGKRKIVNTLACIILSCMLITDDAYSITIASAIFYGIELSRKPAFITIEESLVGKRYKLYGQLIGSLLIGAWYITQWGLWIPVMLAALVLYESLCDWR